MLALALCALGCAGEIKDLDGTGSETDQGNSQGDGDGDGDTSNPGDGDGDTSNPGDGDTNDPGDGDTSNPGDGDTGTPGDGDTNNPGDGDTGTPGDGDTGTPGDGDTGDGDSNDPHQRCVDRINELRATIGLGPLMRWTEQESCSDDQSKRDMQGGGAHGNFGDCEEFGQNTCPGWGSVDDVIGGCLMSMWNEGPPPQDPCEGDCFQAHGHYINMTNPGFTRVACGFFTDDSGQTWSNQNFK